MTTADLDEFVRSAEEVYETPLRSVLEPEYADKFVAIEPASGHYFLGKTLSEAIGAPRRSYPDRLAHALRVGHKGALHC